LKAVTERQGFINGKEFIYNQSEHYLSMPFIIQLSPISFSLFYSNKTKYSQQYVTTRLHFFVLVSGQAIRSAYLTFRCGIKEHWTLSHYCDKNIYRILKFTKVKDMF
jgi:hypothetical protein